MEPIDVTIWAELDEETCPCSGSGWCMREEWEQCFLHYCGQLHPMSRELLLDDPKQLREEERKSQVRWQIEQVKESITQLQVQLRQEQYQVQMLELELINRTPTVRMPAVAVSLLNPHSIISIEGEGELEQETRNG